MLALTFHSHRWGTYRHLPPALSSWAAYHRQRGCCKQLCTWALHYWQGDCRLSLGSHPQTSRPMYRSSGFLDLPLFWGRYWIWFHLIAHGTSVCRLWKEKQTGICNLPSTTGFYFFKFEVISFMLNCSHTFSFIGLHSCCRALQFNSHHPHYPGAFRLCFHVR